MIKTRKTRPGLRQVFLSHSRHDVDVVDRMETLLNKKVGGSLEFYLARSPSGIPVGEEWFQELGVQLNDSSMMLCLLSPDSISAPWVHFEAGYAIARGMPIVPVGIKGQTVDAGGMVFSSRLGRTLASKEDLNVLVQGILRHFELTYTVRFTQAEFAALFPDVPREREDDWRQFVEQVRVLYPNCPDATRDLFEDGGRRKWSVASTRGWLDFNDARFDCTTFTNGSLRSLLLQIPTDAVGNPSWPIAAFERQLMLPLRKSISIELRGGIGFDLSAATLAAGKNPLKPAANGFRSDGMTFSCSPGVSGPAQKSLAVITENDLAPVLASIPFLIGELTRLGAFKPAPSRPS